MASLNTATKQKKNSFYKRVRAWVWVYTKQNSSNFRARLVYAVFVFVHKLTNETAVLLYVVLLAFSVVYWTLA